VNVIRFAAPEEKDIPPDGPISITPRVSREGDSPGLYPSA